MDTYIHNVRDLVKDGTTIVLVDHNDAITTDNNIVVIRTMLTNSCSSLDEFTKALTKRLDSKKRGGSKLSSIAACVMCSDGYALNHASLKGITYHDMRSIWGFIETTSVSSSKDLCSWIKMCTVGRSHNGYMTYAESLSNNEKISSDEREHTLRLGLNTTVKTTGLLQMVPQDTHVVHTGKFSDIMSAVLHDSITLSKIRFYAGHAPLSNIGPTWAQAMNSETI